MAGRRALQDAGAAPEEHRRAAGDDPGRADARAPPRSGCERLTAAGVPCAPVLTRSRGDPASAGAWRTASSSRPSIPAPGGCARRARRRGSPARPPAFAAARRRSASTPRRSWPSSATRPTRSRSCVGGQPVIDFYYWPTPNGWKVVDHAGGVRPRYRVVPVNIGKGDQFKPEFLAISPNNRMPAIVDHDADGEAGAGVRVRRHPAASGGAEPAASCRPSRRGRKETLEWLFWQVGNLGPMAGQLSHFVNYAQGEHPYSHQALCQRIQPLPRRAGAAAGGTRVHPRRVFDRRHGVVGPGC